jgi:hypothetical protein
MYKGTCSRRTCWIARGLQLLSMLMVLSTFKSLPSLIKNDLNHPLPFLTFFADYVTPTEPLTLSGQGDHGALGQVVITFVQE